MNKTPTGYAWHFVGATLRDGRPVPADGKTLVHTGPLTLCASGLHASVDPFDALMYAPGATLCLVRIGGEVLHDTDKLVCTKRTIIARMDATVMLRYFARMRAVSVAHHYKAPDVVLDYLMTGDETLRASAWTAAWATAWAATKDAAWVAARTAAGAATGDAARSEFNALVFECFEGPLADIAA